MALNILRQFLMKPEINHHKFIECVTRSTQTQAERTLAFLYYRSRFLDGHGKIPELLADFRTAGLGILRADKIRSILIQDRRTKRVAINAWMIPADRWEEVENELHIAECLVPPTIKRLSDLPKPKLHKTFHNGIFIDLGRMKELKRIKSDKHDLSRLIRMCEELNDNFSRKNYISTIFFVRAILDHVAPVFGFLSFTAVANNYGTKSLKDSFLHLENSSRKIADGYLHNQIRRKESLPNQTQVNFSQDMDLLLGELIRVI